MEQDYKNKIYETRDGKHTAEFLTELKGKKTFPLSFKLKDKETGEEDILSYTRELKFDRYEDKDDKDLVEVKDKKWVNVYPKDYVYSSKGEADKQSGTHRIACLEFVEGEGLK